MRKYDIVVFDLDGTLLDTSEGVIKSLEYTVNEMMLQEITEDEKKSFIGPPITQSLKEKYNLTDEQSVIATKIFRDRYKNYDCLLCEAYPNVFDLLNCLKNMNIKIGVATYKREDYAIKILKHIGIEKYCDSIKGADDEGKLTKADILSSCLKELKCSNYSSALLIGDSEYDAIGAKTVGVNFMGVTYGYGFNINDDLSKYESITFHDNVENIINLFKK